MNNEADRVFKALSDPNRRAMLDRIRDRPGLNVGELAAEFPFSRYATMKHLRVLETADLVIPRRDGRHKRLHLNAVPLQSIYDRWISEYRAHWAATLTSLKREFEKETRIMPTATGLQHLYVVYIRTTSERLWEALTSPTMTRQFFHGTAIEGDFEVGGTLSYMKTGDDGTNSAALVGKVLEFDPPNRLVLTFEFPSQTDAPSQVSYDLEPAGEVVKLTVTHDGFEGETETYRMVRQGWPPILSGLKTLLETGEPLPLG